MSNNKYECKHIRHMLTQNKRFHSKVMKIPIPIYKFGFNNSLVGQFLIFPIEIPIIVKSNDAKEVMIDKY